MAFNPFERLVAARYLRARRKEGFISVIAGFSLAGISLGVATLIIVMAVMNGFRQELLTRILGVGGHVTVYGTPGPLTDYARVTQRLKSVAGVKDAAPLVTGQAMLTVGRRAGGVAVQGIAPDDLARRPIIANNLDHSTLNDTLPNPTSEMLCAWLLRELAAVPHLHAVEVCETDRSSCMVTVDDAGVSL